MILDSNGLVVLEQTGPPGNTGDSCAETSRLMCLQHILKIPTISNVSLFLSPSGVIRYPGSVWGVSDTSSDQVAPLMSAVPCILEDEIISLIKGNGYKTGNNEYITLGCLAQLKRAEGSRIQFLYDLAIIGQALIFLLPWRWNDSTGGITPSSGSVADYLNFINFLAYAKIRHWTWSCRIATWLVKQSTAYNAVVSYYRPEPNVMWLLDIYKQAIPEIWS